jgi:hypothetical protein
METVAPFLRDTGSLAASNPQLIEALPDDRLARGPDPVIDGRREDLGYIFDDLPGTVGTQLDPTDPRLHEGRALREDGQRVVTDSGRTRQGDA